MNSHNSKPAFVSQKTPVAAKDDKDEACLVRASLNATDLTLVDESDDFYDPYNSTGKHFILNANLTQQNRG